MVIYLSPGVYLEVMDDLPADALAHQPQGHGAQCLVRSSWRSAAGTAAFLGVTAPGITDDVVRVDDAAGLDRFMVGAPSGGYLEACVRGYFANGGPPCYVVPVASSFAPDDSSSAAHPAAWFDRLGPLDLPDDVALLCLPDLMAGAAQHGSTLDASAVAGVQMAAVNYADQDLCGCLLLLDTPPGLSPEDALEWRRSTGFDTTSAAIYHPWLKPTVDGDAVPPCGHVAGGLTRAWRETGPQATSVGRPLEGVHSVATAVSRAAQDLLFPYGINVITGSGEGVATRAARNCSTSAERRDLAAQRVLAFLWSNIRAGTAWVLELSMTDEAAWQGLEHDVDDLLRLAWLSGALWGPTAADAYSVGPLERWSDSPRTRSIDVTVTPAIDVRRWFRVVWNLA